VLQITEQVAEKAAELFEYLRRHGEPVGVPDVLIAATAIVNGYGIATNNVKYTSSESSPCESKLGS